MKLFQTATMLASAVTTALFVASPVVRGECAGIQNADIVTELNFYDSKTVTNTLHLPGGELRYDSKLFFALLC